MSTPTCEATQHALASRSGEADGNLLPSELRAHLADCPDCAEFQALVQHLPHLAREEEPSDAEFRALRRSVLREIRREPAPGLLDRLAALLRQPAFAFSCAALAVVAAFFAGRSQAPRPHLPEPWRASEDALVTQVKLAAVQNRGTRTPDRAQYLYDNVRVDEAGGGRVALSFDLSRHVALTLPKEDPLVAEVLSQALVGGSPVDAKLQAIEAADGHLDPKVRDGLIQVMLTDSNLGVRLKAQEKLLEQTGDPKVQEALLSVLQTAESVQMRLLAIDYLTRQRISPDRLRQALAPAGRRDAVTLKAMNYLNQSGDFR